MRTDVTVRAADGTEHDLALLTPAGTRWDAVAPGVESAVGSRPTRCGPRRLADGSIIGDRPLVSGAVLGAAPPHPDPVFPRLEVVGGRDGAVGVPLKNGLLVGRDPSCDVVLGDPRLSRRHLVVSVTGEAAVANEVGVPGRMSANGRRVRVCELTEHRPVRIGDTLLAVAAAHRPPIPSDPPDVVLPDVPDAPAKAPQSLAAAVVPVLLAAGLAWLTGAWEFLAFAALGPIAALIAARSERRRGRRALRAAQERYFDGLVRSETEIAAGLSAEVLRRRDAHPHPAALLREFAGATPDDLVVRIGLGTLPSRLKVICRGVAGPAALLSDVPVTVDLAAGPLGIAGPGPLTTGLACWLVAQLAVRGHRPKVVPDPVGTEWRWLRWLPPAHDDTVIVVAGTAGDLPASCTTTVVALDDATAWLRMPGGIGLAALVDGVDTRWCETLARAVAGSPRPAGFGVPERCRLGDVLPIADDRTVLEQWDAADGSARLAIGVGADGPVAVDLDRDGPHALIAGSTGSGKSELLRSLVVGLALTYPPEHLTFLLFDYKGGAAFADCAALPHTVGLVTDLDDQLTRRVLRSLDSEVRRRERILAAAGAADLDEYHRSGAAHVLARLVIVVDEFATLAEELGGFVAGLVGIARRGRSLGLHLVLATQRPAGVVSPEIRANCALRICLRVTDAGDSVDVVDTDAAAAIPSSSPGRAYLRAGGRTRAVQVASVSGRTRPSEDAIRVVLLDDSHRLPAADNAATELQRAVERVRHAAQRRPDRTPPRRPWLPPLPSNVPLAESGVDGTVVVGLVDRPDDQAQPQLTLDLSRGATIVLTGRAGSGRTTAAHTIAVAAARMFSPAELSLHVIETGGATLAGLRALPHTGTVATAGDGFELVSALVARLTEPPADGPTLLLVIGWDQLLAASEEHDNGRTADRVLTIARDAAASRTTVVITGGRATLAPRILGLASSRFVFALGDPGDYLAAGISADAVPSSLPPGRAVRVADSAEVQFARATLVADDRVPNDALRLRPLPTRVSVAELSAPPGTVGLGVGGDAAEPIAVDLVGSRARLLVAGPPRSGRTTLLRTVLAQCSTDCAVVAPARSPLVRFAHERGVPVVSEGSDRPGARLLLVDDLDHVADTALGDALDRWLADGATAAVATGRTDALAVGYRGVIARLRAACCGIVLHPAPGDTAVLGVPVPGTRAVRPAGRGALVPDPGWGLGAEPLPIQIAIDPAPVRS